MMGSILGILKLTFEKFLDVVMFLNILFQFLILF